MAEPTAWVWVPDVLRTPGDDLERQAGQLGDRAAALDELAWRLQREVEAVEPLLVDVIAGWCPEVFDGRAARTGYAALLDQRAEVRRAAQDLTDTVQAIRAEAARVRDERDDVLHRLAALPS